MNIHIARKYKSLLILVILIFVVCECNFGQSNEKEVYQKLSKTQLVSSFEQVGGDEGAARIDELMQAVFGNPNSHAYVIIYCGKICKYSEVEAHIAGIEEGLLFRNYDRNKIVVISGGFREKTTVEFWIVPEGECPPRPKPTINIKDVKFQRTRTKIYRPYWCC